MERRNRCGGRGQLNPPGSSQQQSGPQPQASATSAHWAEGMGPWGLGYFLAGTLGSHFTF